MKDRTDKCVVAGGDKRMDFLAELLRERGCDARRIFTGNEEKIKGMQLIKDSDIVILPVPVLKNGRLNTEGGGEIWHDEIAECIQAGQMVFGGCIPVQLENAARDAGAGVFDFMKDERTAVQNTLATAEGAIARAIYASPRNLTGSRCLIAGYGRCGSTLLAYLKGMGCKTAVCETEETKRARAETYADEVLTPEELFAYTGKADFIFNTVPGPVLTEEVLKTVRQDTVVLDLASAPGGVDYDAAQRLGIKAELLPGLPGKVSPLASAEILAEMILRAAPPAKTPSLRKRGAYSCREGKILKN